MEKTKCREKVFSLGKALIMGFLTVSLLGGSQASYAADSTPNNFYHGKVLSIIEDGTRQAGGVDQPYQTLKVGLLEGPEAGKSFVIEYGGVNSIQENQKVSKNESVILERSEQNGKVSYILSDHNRLPSLIWISIAFVLLAIFFARLKGFTSILGMLFGMAILIGFIIPQILAGANPLLMSLVGAVLIGFVSIYLAHGFNRRTTIALASTLITLTIATLLAYLSVFFTKMSGTGQEESWYLQLEGFQKIDLRGILLAGIIIGVLGILEDITTAQSAVVDEISKADPGLSFSELYKRGLSVGQEHIAALINTLVLAYAGASFPLLLLFSIDKTTPWWVTVNGEFVAQEILRTLIGSIALVLAVPISTSLAASFLKEKKRPHKIGLK